ncbi:CHASE2 domain-containing protein [Leptolyngbyaceae cyanobacterium CCMR0082]|uniref:CHASE2 domain-containing protein n=2 Tax=Adonisia turfae TaxID=2950184 RepID=A0A6M0SGN9_9CYAN|nr:CHASE2 domain-containing protein [Adonisia turfae]NEZ57838.1 CHASE2 domain-containing protein [Adonisia turfae CCMR0081]NEZ67738.1 CHASE2 domain-containing protein [Adonisia turfae CCMR0082]
MSNKSSIYTTGGTVQAGGGIYLIRKADNELLQLCRDGKFAYVLTSRQMGKSSLMVETAKRLEEESINSVIIDLTKIGTAVTAEQWYLGILTEIDETLMLNTDIFEWWEKYKHLGITQRLTRFFEEVLLEEIEGRIVLFIDEIDTTLSLNFTDDFFIAIRYFYTARAQKTKLKRFSFVLLGVASPNELIQDPKRTPFNIGTQIELTDFSQKELLPLAEGLNIEPHNKTNTIDEVVLWTGGHPYLTQYLFQKLSEKPQKSYSREKITEIVTQSFLLPNESQDSNLSFVRDMLIKRSPDKWMTLREYKTVVNNRGIDDDKRSLIKNHLKLSGIVTNRNGKLQTRNRIYQKVFDNKWITKQLSLMRPSIRTIIGSSFLTSIAIIIIKSLGAFVPLELGIHDVIVSYAYDKGPDPRILLVEINKQDLDNQLSDSPSDQSIADAIEIIQSHNPATIGLDLHRNFPIGEGRPALARSLAADNIIGITKLGDFQRERIPPAPELRPEQVSFNDFPLDADDKIRRNLLYASLSTDEDAEVFISFGLLVAMHYLEKQHGLQPAPGDTEDEFLKLGDTAFKLMNSTFGGYQDVDTSGYQIPMAYRSPTQVARRVSLTDILTGAVNPESITNKVVLIGITAYTSNEKFFTPYNIRSDTFHTSGVEIHTHMVSQILTAVLDKRPLPSSLSEIYEAAYITVLTVVSGLLIRHIFFYKFYVLCTIFITILGVLFLTHALYWAIWTYWIPLFAPALSLSMVNVVVAIWMRTERLLIVHSSSIG